MKKLFICAILFALLATLPAHSDKWYDNPDPAATGGLSGKVVNAELAEAVAIEQTAFKFYHGVVDTAAGTYTFNNLPPGRYDLLLKLKEDVLEGMRLDVFGETEVLPKEDKDAIWELIKISDDFFHDKKIVRMGGTKKLQKLFVEQLRTATIYNPDGSIAVGRMIRRLDYSIVKKTRVVWQIDIKSPRYLFREERDKKGSGSTLRFHYIEGLGGIRVADEMVEAPEVGPKAPLKEKSDK